MCTFPGWNYSLFTSGVHRITAALVFAEEVTELSQQFLPPFTPPVNTLHMHGELTVADGGVGI